MAEPKPKQGTEENIPDNKGVKLPAFRGSEIIRVASGIDKDVLSIILKPDEMYTKEEYTKLLEAFMKREIKPVEDKEVK